MLTLLPHFLNNPNDVLHYSVLCCSDVQLQRSLFQEHIFRLRYVEGHDNLIINRPDEFAPSDENSQPDSNKFFKKKMQFQRNSIRVGTAFIVLPSHRI